MCYNTLKIKKKMGQEDKVVQYYIFILKLRRNSRKNSGKIIYYTGVTTNPPHRLKELRAGIGCEWIKRNMLSSIGYVWMESTTNPTEASKIKNRVKRLNVREKLDLIDKPFRELDAKRTKIDTFK